MARHARLAGLVAALALLATANGCSSAPSPREQVRGYFTALNAAAAKGPAAQSAYLRRTQHPQFTSRYCANGDLTYTERPTLSTLRGDKNWAPPGGSHPAGKVYSVAVLFSAHRAGNPVATQISLARVVLWHGKVYGFSPCTQS